MHLMIVIQTSKLKLISFLISSHNFGEHLIENDLLKIPIHVCWIFSHMYFFYESKVRFLYSIISYDA